MSTRKILTLLALVVVAILLLSATPVNGGERAASIHDWKQTPDRPSQWCKELGSAPGYSRICVEYGHGSTPMYIHQSRCLDGRYSFIAWRKGNVHSGLSCKGSVRVRELEQKTGALPTELLEELAKPSPRERARKK